MTEFTPAAFAAKLAELAVAAQKAEHRALEQAARIVEHEVKPEIAHDRDASDPFAGWPNPAPSTREQQQPLGHADPLHDGIEHTVVGNEAHVGSNSESTAHQELGTACISPRSFLGGAMMRKTDEVLKIVGEGVVGVLIGRGFKGTPRL